MYITGVDLDPRYGEKEQRAEVPNFLKKLDLIAIMMRLFFQQNRKAQGHAIQAKKVVFSMKQIVIQLIKQKKKTNPFSNICSELFNTLNERSINPLEKSYTNHLLTKGSNTILKKIGEETAEFIMACKDNDKKSISNEAADIIYHLQVALLHNGVDWRDVLSVLESRRKKNSLE